jgi:hypothetical protein
MGKWADTEKEDSKIPGMQFEIGTAPIEVGQGRDTGLTLNGWRKCWILA